MANNGLMASGQPYMQNINDYIRYLLAAQQDPYGFMGETPPVNMWMGDQTSTQDFLRQLGGMYGQMNGQNPFGGGFAAGPESTPWGSTSEGGMGWWEQAPDWWNQQPEAANPQIPAWMREQLGIEQVPENPSMPGDGSIASGIDPATSAVTGGKGWNPWTKLLPNISAEQLNTPLGQQIKDMAENGPEMFTQAPDWYKNAPSWWEGAQGPSMYDQEWTSQLAPNWWKQAKQQMDPEFMQQYKAYWQDPANKGLKKQYKQNPYFNYSATDQPLGEDWWKVLPPNWWKTWKQQVGKQNPEWWNQYANYWQQPQAKQNREKGWAQEGWWNQYSTNQQQPTSAYGQ